MTASALPNALRGECALAIAGTAYVMRPSFTALVAAEEELGPLFALVERAGAGELRLAEMTALFWHCLPDGDRPERETVGAAVVAQGLAACAAPLRVLLGQILKGSA
ncbi:gene transfer agent family protein [Novosphingobium kaempferiae]|uniref:gene transfer agent family protein n=1 Tax=Novosphingobium kaempferiae TaxID=2896849 RepID=UPI001E3BA9AA|nr:gene transfer agent family protein [Novosphingobium kaempferiae]